MHNQPVQIFKPSLIRIVVAAVLILAALPGRMTAQENNFPVSPASPDASGATANSVPQIIQFSGTLGGAPSGTVSITFTLYESEQGGTALWSETQNVQVNAQGQYTALLGSTSPDGLPLNLFTTVQAHWLAAQPLVQGFAEQPRVMLVGVPYAMKAADADTLGGLPASAFIQAAPSGAAGSGSSVAGTAVNALAGAGSAGSTSNGKGSPKSGKPTNCTAVTTNTGGIPQDVIPMWDGTSDCNLVNTPNSGTAAVNGNLNLGAANYYAIGGSPVLRIPATIVGQVSNLSVGVGAGSGGGLNTFSGFNAGHNNPDSSVYNTFTGGLAGYNSMGQSNSYYGARAGFATLDGSFDTFIGAEAGGTNEGSYNTFSGYLAGAHSNGSYNTFYGSESGVNNNANGNSFYGYQSGVSNITATGNSFYGYQTGVNNTASENTFVGYKAGASNTTGSSNSFVGNSAGLNSNTGLGNTTGFQNTYVGMEAGGSGLTMTGSNNIFVGYGAGDAEGDVSNNIEIGNTGPPYEASPGCVAPFSNCSNQILIGTLGTQTDTYIQGIYNAPPPSFFPSKPVCVDSNGKLWGENIYSSQYDCNIIVGISSRRFKEQIVDMGDSSSRLFQLRPVTFFYKPQYDDGAHALRYGLIAEEVAEVYPEMVVYDKGGQPLAVRYEALAPMLLNELQKQHTVVAAQQDVIETHQEQVNAQQQQMQAQQQQIEQLQQRLSRLESLIAKK